MKTYAHISTCVFLLFVFFLQKVNASQVLIDLLPSIVFEMLVVPAMKERKRKGSKAVIADLRKELGRSSR